MNKAFKEKVYLVGIGGIGMSALARYFHAMGHQVIGYDKAINQMTKRLQAEGIGVTHINEEDAVPHPFREKEEVLVIYTPAIPKDDAILNYFKENGFECLKRAEVLGLLSKGIFTIAVAGTHGKTTITSMIAHLLKKGNKKFNAFLGGISRDFGTNLILDPEAEIMLTEADEFDRSFLQLHPNILVVSSVDLDHLDIYESEKDLLDTYSKLIDQIVVKGKLFSHFGIAERLNSKNDVSIKEYAIEEDKAEVSIERIRIESGNYVFDLKQEGKLIENLVCGLPGIHNVENAAVAASVALAVGVDQKIIKEALSSFRGVQRRFDVHINTSEFVYIDDYAHHPKELESLIKSIRQLYPTRKITMVFQPHLFSRTKDFGEEFGEVLATCDELILLEIYPARELPIEGIDSRWLSAKVNKEGVPICQKAQLMNILKSRNVDLLVTAGAGDIDTMVEPIIDYYA